MKRPLPLWLAAVVPTTLAGHGFAYALAGQSAADGRHAWLLPTLECSLALLIAVSLVRTHESLLKARVLIHTPAERSVAALWCRLAFSQIALFGVIEQLEGSHISLTGILVQLCLAAVIACVLAAFARLMIECARGARLAGVYLLRLLQGANSFVSSRPAPIAYALAVRAGTARFQRPPP